MESGNKDVTVRVARDRDAAEIANVHLNAWREAYEELLPGNFIDDLPLTFRRRMERWQKTFSSKPLGTEVWVAESARFGIVGFVNVVKARDEKYQEYGELGAIYLLKQFKGKGIGFLMLKTAFAFLKDQGFHQAYCWVLKDNPTIRFYQKTGGQIGSDTKQDKRPDVELNEVICMWTCLELGEYG